MKIITIPLPIYKTNIELWCGTKNQAEKMFKKTEYASDGYVTKFQPKGGKFLAGDGLWPVVWVDSTLTPADLCAAVTHEMLHATAYLLGERNLKLETSEEAYTYLLEYLVCESFKALDIKR